VHQEAEVDGRQLLDRWVERGLIQPEQAEHIRVEEGWGPAQPTSMCRLPLAVTALSWLKRWGTWVAY
jgi:hypothetical protein